MRILPVPSICQPSLSVSLIKYSFPSVFLILLLPFTNNLNYVYYCLNFSFFLSVNNVGTVASGIYNCHATMFVNGKPPTLSGIKFSVAAL